MVGRTSLVVVASLLLVVVASAASETSSSVVDDEVGAWRVICQAGSCDAYQYGRGGSRPTILRVKPGDGQAPEMRIEGGPFTPSGEVRFNIDGEWVTGGLASTLRAESGGDLVLEPDDITYALARRMQKGKLLELTVPRGQDAEPVEFDLDGFSEALSRVIDPSESDAEGTQILSETERDTAVERAILKASPDYDREMVEVSGQKARYIYNRVDLNNDDQDEVIVYLLGSYFCGTGGCDLLVLTETEDGYSVINSFATSRVPIVVTGDRANGWNDLLRLVSGGGAAPVYVRHTFDGEKYIEKERLSAEVVPEGTAYLADELSFESGIPFEPQN